MDNIEDVRRMALDDLYFFAKGVLKNYRLTPSLHLPICRMLEGDGNRFLFVLPRGFLKTTLISQAYPLWAAVRNPDIRILLAQNTYSNAVKKLRTIRNIIETNDFFRTLFPEVLPDETCIWKTDSLQLKRKGSFSEGTFEAGGIRTQVVSRHYDIIIEDDTVSPEQDQMGGVNIIPDREDIEKAIGYHRLVTPLLTSFSKGRIIVVGTRWFEDDLISWIQKNEQYYRVYERKAIEDDKPTYPEQYPLETLDQIRQSLGPYMFNCLYLNQPTRSEDMVFKPEWIQYYENPPTVDPVITVDLAGDPAVQRSSSDYNVVMVAGKDYSTGRLYVLDYWRERCGPGPVVDAIFQLAERWNCKRVAIESIGYQASMHYWLKEQMMGRGQWFVIEPLRSSHRSKNSRILGLQPCFASGTMFVRTWMKDLVSELLAFPSGTHDDLIDALAYQLEFHRPSAKVQEKKKARLDPFSLEAAIEELRGKSKRHHALYWSTL